MKILLVDDSKAMRMIVMRQLRQIGYGDSEFTEANNGQEALDVIVSDPPSLVLCDWNMPEMSGIELLNALNERSIKVPFGFVTSEGTPEMRQLAADAGAKFLVAKPFTADDLQAALSAV
jgi:two-component system, chemotaxis family, chemotaxis protein CheY